MIYKEPIIKHKNVQSYYLKKKIIRHVFFYYQIGKNLK